MLFIFNLAVLMLSVVVHEVAHGISANRLGDPTAKQMGRLSPNPLRHLELTGSFLIPLLSFLFGGFIFGWAKPVPYNPYNLRNQKWGPAAVALAGPASNFLVAICFGLALRFVGAIPFATAVAVSVIVYVNLLLGVFNLMPIPPLDGSKIIAPLLPYRYENLFLSLERYGFTLVIIFLIFIFPIVARIIPLLFKLITGFTLGF